MSIPTVHPSDFDPTYGLRLDEPSWVRPAMTKLYGITVEVYFIDRRERIECTVTVTGNTHSFFENFAVGRNSSV